MRQPFGSICLVFLLVNFVIRLPHFSGDNEIPLFPSLFLHIKRWSESVAVLTRLSSPPYRRRGIRRLVVNIHEGIESTLMLLHQRLQPQPHHPAIQVIKEYGSLPLIECYPGQLNQVFMNILSNAIDALSQDNQKKTPEEIRKSPSTITIQTTLLDSDWAEISIKDNGPGITASIKPRIFDPFFTTKRVGEGTGLGLSISYQIIVENHSGKIECVSVMGKGAEFRITIPIKQKTVDQDPQLNFASGTNADE
jgi:signal transduction histidine kinase